MMRKMDEMELKINFDAIRSAWLFTVIALFLWGIYDFINLGIVTLPMYLLIVQHLVYFLATQISKWKVGDGSGASAMIWYSIAFTVCLIGFGAILIFTTR